MRSLLVFIALLYIAAVIGERLGTITGHALGL